MLASVKKPPTLGSILFFCLSSVSIGSFVGAVRGEETPERAKMFHETVPVEKGDRCIVCNTPLQPDDTVYLVEGQRVGIMEAMEPTLFSDPWRYIGRLRPRGGLFGGEVTRAGAISDAWLLLGIYVTLGLAFAAICAHRALNTEQPPIRWFLAGLLLNVFAYLALMIRSAEREGRTARKYSGVVKIPSTVEPQTCSNCSALNHPSASKCSSCGVELTPSLSSEVTRLHRSAK